MLVAGMEDDMRRISFSTALLEVNSGDMLLDKVCTAGDLSLCPVDVTMLEGAEDTALLADVVVSPAPCVQMPFSIAAPCSCLSLCLGSMLV